MWGHCWAEPPRVSGTAQGAILSGTLSSSKMCFIMGCAQRGRPCRAGQPTLPSLGLHTASHSAFPSAASSCARPLLQEASWSTRLTPLQSPGAAPDQTAIAEPHCSRTITRSRGFRGPGRGRRQVRCLSSRGTD